MFIPVDRQFNWHDPPFVTALLIFANLVCFALLQHDDAIYEDAAYSFYLDSSLAQYEIPAYAAVLRARGEPARATLLESRWSSGSVPAQRSVARQLLVDGEFLTALREEQIITPEADNYGRWRRDRDRFEAMLNKVSAYRFALIPSHATAAAFVTHLFLHSDVCLLAWTRMLLLMFGYALESLVGHRALLGTYMLGGVSSGVLFMLSAPHSAHWGIGASGAIAALVGMYTVLFGLRRVRFLYFLGFYFNYVTAPAIVILGFWLVWEIYQYFWSPGYVNSVAHIGGLLSGAALGMIARRFVGPAEHQRLDKDDIDAQFRARYEEGLRYVAALDLDQARRIFLELQHEQPHNTELMLQLYNIAKFSPHSEEYHRRAHQLLGRDEDGGISPQVAHDIYVEYTAKAVPHARFKPDLLLRLLKRFATTGYLEDAENIMRQLLRHQADVPGLPGALRLLAGECRRQNHNERAKYYADLLRAHYPDSSEAGMLRR
ncbi:MAG: rhomboid family intramembrane serine protease [Pseudomonadota bacterium]|nr:MAG: rhomboid family intramembrane serine protease [Pseudomonadota bacterium]